MNRFYRNDSPLRGVLFCRLLLLGLAASALPAGRVLRGKAGQSSLSPREALATFVLEDPNLDVRLVAAEPEVVDPVAFAFDGRGRMLVAEMRDYPLGPPGAGRVRFLEDRDGDGRFERSVIFADRLNYPNSVCPWRGGVFVSSAPDILYLKDEDGDGRADIRRVVFTGFGTWNPQHLVNGLTYGVDGWIYGANGDSHGEVRSPLWPKERRVSIRGLDFRFLPDRPVLEPISGQCQFGLSFDDRGSRFICNNRTHLRHVVLPRRYLVRNPYLSVRSVIRDVPDHGAACKVFQRSKPQKRFNDFGHVGFTTSACGITIYRGEALGPGYYGNGFSCEPVGNLVHRDVLEPRGATYVARRAREGVEFLASTDPWFRPVFLATGPDGALYLADMYREVIEHPKWIPDEVEKTLDLRRGADRGRIYRIARRSRKPGPLPVLEGETTEDLARRLRGLNVWLRLTAQRLLQERGDRSAVPLLARLLREEGSWQARLHALRALDLLGALEVERAGDLVRRALSDPHPAVREDALRIAEPFLVKSSLPSGLLEEKVIELARDPDPRVRFQAAFTLGYVRRAGAVGALASLFLEHAGDPWFETAVLSSVPERASQLFTSLLDPQTDHSGGGASPASRMRFLSRLAGIIGKREVPGEIAMAIRAVASAGKGGEGKGKGLAGSLRWRMAFVAGLASGEAGRRALAEALRSRGRGSGRAKDKSEDARASSSIWKLYSDASALALSRDRGDTERIEAVRLLGRFPFEYAGKGPLKNLLDPRQPRDVQLAAVQALSEMAGREVARCLLERWKAYSPAVRREVLEALLARRERVPFLLDGVESGEILPGEVPPAKSEALLKDPDRSIRERAEKLFSGRVPGDREKVYRSLREKVLALEGSRARGREVFRRECATCHLFEGEGHAVGPDLADSRKQDRESLLLHIVDPNRVIDPKFLSYSAVTRGGSVVSGILSGESGPSVTLRRAEGIEETVLRREIRALSSSGISIMPDGLEEKLSPQDLADVIEYLRKGPNREGEAPADPFSFES